MPAFFHKKPDLDNGQIGAETELMKTRFFIVGLLDVPNPEALQYRVDELRAQLMGDAYFKSVPSMQPNARKTALAFHAKDDIPEVRRDVFRLLGETEGLKFFAAVTDKLSVLEYVRHNKDREPNYHYRPNDLYDYLTQHLFKQRLRQPGRCDIILSRRDRFDRSASLRELVEAARIPSKTTQSNVTGDTTVHISLATPKEHAGLQAVDYFVWALQRLYERGEERYLAYLWKAVRLVHDTDDRREAGYGVSYTQSKPLTAECLRWREQK